MRKSGSLGFLQSEGDAEDKEAQKKIEKALKDTFRPEFINRIDEIITFSPLSVEDMSEIVDLQMKEISERLADVGLKVALSDKTRTWLAQEGYDSAFGARPLKRALQKFIESPLSIKLLEGEFAAGDVVAVDVNDDNEVVFTRKKGAAKKAEKKSEVSAEA